MTEASSTSTEARELELVSKVEFAILNVATSENASVRVRVIQFAYKLHTFIKSPTSMISECTNYANAPKISQSLILTSNRLFIHQKTWCNQKVSDLPLDYTSGLSYPSSPTEWDSVSTQYHAQLTETIRSRRADHGQVHT